MACDAFRCCHVLEALISQREFTQNLVDPTLIETDSSRHVMSAERVAERQGCHPLVASAVAAADRIVKLAQLSHCFGLPFSGNTVDRVRRLEIVKRKAGVSVAR